MFNMAFQVVFSAKNVPRFSFGLLVAPKLKKREGAIMPPRALTSFQRPGQIGLICTGQFKKNLNTSYVRVYREGVVNFNFEISKLSFHIRCLQYSKRLTLLI